MSILATVRLKTGPVTIIGSYRHTRSGGVHAVIHDANSLSDKNSGSSPYRTLCETHQYLYTGINGKLDPHGKKVYISDAPFRDVTCKRCLRIMEKYGPKATDKPKQKKFFLVTFDDGDMETYNNFAKLQNKMKQYQEEITKVCIVDSYRTISMKTVLVDEDGKEITERSLE